ncbi:MAG TPA: beta-ketoacyl synthase N-terminal-like domain-containing protein [Planctomycetota bacterium]|nr:beta-ketoacyl synthase N-terminal-like domain-containing protein [Planctomycetota bacterium]HRR78754.1 beta-ketoacyl synthase N-terminal-like domain-containing protein [Planctomycetota bacterium]HRT95233.1 beta-ketoacyl synthase N-terminal-like domain-containing protein [Planctomycetota bacterium]
MNGSDVVITGVGCITPLGLSLEALSTALREGRPGFGELASFDASAYPCRFGAEVLDLELADFIESSKTYVDRTSAFALAACATALRDAHWTGDESVGLILGTAWGCMDSLQLFAQKLVEGKPKFVSPLPFTHSYANAPNSLASIEFKLRGFNACLTSGHVSGLAAVEYACRRVALGKEKRLLAGGSESLSEPVFHAYCRRGRLHPGQEPRPYDPASSGMLLGEGAAVVAVEEAESARQWNTPVLARVLGWASCHGESVADGLARSMRDALARGGIRFGDVDAILGIGCGSPAFDAAEIEAIRAVFSGARPALTSVKGWLGEAMGAGGAVSLAAALACLEDRFLPAALPTYGPLPDGVRLVAGEPLDGPVGTLLVNAADPSGACASLVLASA